VVSSRPEDFTDTDGQAKAGGVEDPACGLPSCHISEVPAVMEEVITKEKKTPLFLDTSPERKVM
jgi:hypothetical protein